MNLDDLRNKIDNVDTKILELLSQRVDIVKKVGKLKEENSEKVEYYRSEREAKIIRKLLEKNKSDIPDENISNIFKDIISACRALEYKLKVSYLGPAGTFSNEALIKHFGKNNDAVPEKTIKEVFRKISNNLSDFGIIPIENSTEGSVNETLNCLMQYNISICAEVEIPIHHYLLTSHDNIESKGKITRIYSHNQSLAQCNNYLTQNYPYADKVATTSTAQAANYIKHEWNSAAIASYTASEIYNLEIIAKKIEDNPNNTTRFLIIGNYKTEVSGEDKTSILVATQNKPGALLDLLMPFKTNGIDLTRLETRPSQNDKWSYVFFIDFKGHLKEEKTKKALEELQKISIYLKILGSYPRAF